TVPVLFTTPLPPGQTPPVAAVVVDVMCTVKLLPTCVVPNGTVTPPTPPQVRIPRLIAHVLFQPPPWPAIVQFRPGLIGSGSTRVTFFASPVPVLKTVTVKPICSPAFTCAASAVFTIWIPGAATQIVASELSV